MPSSPAHQPATWSTTVEDEAALGSVVATLAAMLRAGDLVTLSGGLGAGKTTLARGIIRALVDDPDIDVPSPTFTLLQTYDGPSFPIAHADLYRLAGEEDLAELGWDEAVDAGLVLAEWPDRLGSRLPRDRLDVALSLVPGASDGARMVVVTGHGAMAPRLRQAQAIGSLLQQAGFAGAGRTFMTGDASTRAYERLRRPEGATAVLMISPPRADAVVVRFGQPYHHVARLAHDIRPFLAVDRALYERGISVPEIYAVDAERGLAVIEDLGGEPVVSDGTPIPERYSAATALLAWLHDQTLPHDIPGPDGPHTIPPYDLDALLIEAELVLDWYAPEVAKVTLPASARADFISICSKLFGDVLAGPKTWTLRDYHSPNLIWQSDRQGLARLGVIDFQDCVIGHPAYDLASLLQDARITVPDALELQLLGEYAQHRRRVNALFDMASFAEAYAVLGVQRATKILGAFARLNKRDRKPHYLAHLPRIEGYLAKGLAHPALGEMRFWYKTYLPRTLGLRL